MKVAVDTNVLVRAAVCDDPAQASIATKVLSDAELIAVALPCLCEFVWVLLRVYGFQPSDAVAALRALLAVANVEVNRPAYRCSKLAGILPMASLPMKEIGSVEKPSFPSTKKRLPLSRHKVNQHAFCEKKG